MINSGRIQYFVQYGSGPYLKPVYIGSLSTIMNLAVAKKSGLDLLNMQLQEEIAPGVRSHFRYKKL